MANVLRIGHQAQVKSQEKAWRDAVIVFLNDRKMSGCAERTVEWYERTLIPWLRYLDNIRIPNVVDLDQTHIAGYIQMLRANGNSPSGINTKLRAVRSFLNYLAEWEFCKPVKVRMLKYDRKIIETFTESEVKKLLEKPDLSKVTFAKYRDFMLISFLLGTGVRLRTLRYLHVRDIDFIEKEIFLRETKGKVQYRIPLSKVLEKLLYEYIKKADLKDDDFLFSNQFGGQLSDRTIEERMESYCMDRGINTERVRCSPHTCRHTFAIMGIRGGVGLLEMQKLLGHKTLEMTRMYANLSMDDVKKTFTSPLDQLATAQRTGRRVIKLAEK